jgi:exopolysaccharide biosynthesis polyprenyl glycosylphosphotransferase
MAITAPDVEQRRLVQDASFAPARTIRRRLVGRALLCADLLGLSLAYGAGAIADDGKTFAQVGASVAFVLTLPLWVSGAKLLGLYDRDDQRPDQSTLDDLGRIFQLVTVGSWLALAILWLSGVRVPETASLTFWLSAIAAVSVFRAAARAAVRRHPGFQQDTIIVGAGDVGQLVGRKLAHHPELGLRLVGFVDSEPKTMRGDLAGLPVLGAPADILDIVARHDVERVIVAFSHDSHQRLVELVRSLQGLEVQIDLVPRLFEAVGPVVAMHAIEGMPLVTLPPAHPSHLARKAKRLFDVLVAAIVLVFALPLMALIAWKIKRDSSGPILFRQQRLGEGQREFTLLKFRTMAVDTDDGPHRDFLRGIMDLTALPSESNLYKATRADEVTKVGAWLRRTSLDELPQLFNVVRGEMSLVGPRPCIPYETDLFEPHHFDRFLVPAGMTGLWQVAARAHATFKEALDLDAAYARNWSFRLDLWLLGRTPAVVLRTKETA